MGVNKLKRMKIIPVEDSVTSKVIDLDDFGKWSMVFGIFMVNSATVYTFINFAYFFSIRDCNPNIYNSSIHPIYGDSV